MTYAEEIRRQAEAAPRAALDAVAGALWKAFGEGRVSEAEAEALSTLIDLRRSSKNGPRPGQGTNETILAPNSANYQYRAGCPRKLVGSRPRTDASMERRRRWAASGRLPPAIAAGFTLAEQAVLALVAAETTRRGDCRLTIEHVAAVVGVSRSTVKTALRQARTLGLVTIEERPVTAWRNLSNVVRVVSPEWLAWMRLARRPSLQGGGVKSPTGTPTDIPYPVNSGPWRAKKGCRQAAGDLDRSASTEVGAACRTGRAMR
ncbi:helix-turn-helix domain-containing protein [Methylobacterium trifolii]|uniref:Helix-turn-helix domain-containing protein n=1 Tax=Methylobacterium trifolii TaxID=1003092 RepID=A0ABQ4TZ27_9HYPH|nr:helix-turn-helix domain-containing protein [Methylobacterium trifolii]GJE59115.1 hypothetical protein MPOCJGCO_1202 [Methylobacterium trifolii]